MSGTSNATTNGRRTNRSSARPGSLRAKRLPASAPKTERTGPRDTCKHRWSWANIGHTPSQSIGAILPGTHSDVISTEGSITFIQTANELPPACHRQDRSRQPITTTPTETASQSSPCPYSADDLADLENHCNLASADDMKNPGNLETGHERKTLISVRFTALLIRILFGFPFLMNLTKRLKQF